MELWQAAFLGVIEGLTEFLPVSSTGHMILAAYAMGISNIEFVKTFEIVIQLGAITAVVGQYAKTVLGNRKLPGKIILTFIPTGIVGLLAYDFVKTYLLGSPLVTVISLIVGGLIIICLERTLLKGSKRDQDNLTVNNLPISKCLVMGLFQAVAIIPGVSRSGATIVGGMSLGLSRREATELSFLMAVPTLFFASSWDLLNSGFTFSSNELLLLAIGFVVSLIVAWVAVKVFISYLKVHTLEMFGWYRIGAGVVYGLVFLV